MSSMDTPLRKIRLNKRQSLNRVARETQIDPGNLSRIERGLARASLEVAERLAKYYGGDISELQILYPERFMSVNNNHNNSPFAG